MRHANEQGLNGSTDADRLATAGTTRGPLTRRLRVTVLMLMASALLVVIAPPATAGPSGIDRMEHAGWTCIDFGPLGVHCFNEPSSAFASGDLTSVQMRVFMVDEDGHETYEGTEQFIRVDVFERNPNLERPCPREGGHWHDLRPEYGLNYYACHRFG